ACRPRGLRGARRGELLVDPRHSLESRPAAPSPGISARASRAAVRGVGAAGRRAVHVLARLNSPSPAPLRPRPARGVLRRARAGDSDAPRPRGADELLDPTPRALAQVPAHRRRARPALSRAVDVDSRCASGTRCASGPHYHGAAARETVLGATDRAPREGGPCRLAPRAPADAAVR